MEHRTVNTLIKARTLIQHGWTRGAPARDSAGWEVAPIAKNAVRYCAIGALDAQQQPDDVYLPACHFLTAALPAPYTVLLRYNDARTTTQADILALYDRAICIASKPLF